MIKIRFYMKNTNAVNENLIKQEEDLLLTFIEIKLCTGINAKNPAR
jgi:hypothetical protein